jgi:aminoglycoside phosphotransferase family enzyme/predicted kinase
MPESLGNLMDLQRLIAGLAQTQAYPFPVDQVTVRQTHISVVFLAGDYVYKLKKPVNFGFLDFSTLAKRLQYCREEVRLNRRLAAPVYEAVVPVTEKEGKLAWEADGEAIEWGVKMRRLPDEARLSEHLRRGSVTDGDIDELAHVLAKFHAQAESGSHASAFGKFEVVAGNARENFVQSASLRGTTISDRVFEYFRDLTEAELARLGPIIQGRSDRGMTRETHGDLHLNHIYFFPEMSAGGRWLIIDCIEFNERFRYADPMADLAFLAMDLKYQGFPRQAEALIANYVRASGDSEGQVLLPFYIAYRAAVRAKVEGLELTEKEIPAEEKSAALARSRAHWLLGYSTLLPASQRPALVLIGGLPGTGKSTLAAELCRQAGLTIIRSDLVRKELAGLEQGEPPPSPPPPLSPPRIRGGRGGSERGGLGRGIYSAEMTDRTYRECLRQAEEQLFQGRRVIVDANFRTEAQRRMFLEAAHRWALPGCLIWCRADEAVIRTRLQERRGDASDADWTVYLQAARECQPFSQATRTNVYGIDTGGPIAESLRQAIAILRTLQWV